MVPRRLTEGRSSIRVRVERVPVDHLLFPEHRHPKRQTPLQFAAWSELRYAAYSFVMPDFDL